MTLHPEEVDTNITKTAFELALKRLYGVDISAEEDIEAVGLFATGCWLEMQDLVDAAIESMLRQMAVDNVALLIRLVTSQYYGKAGDRILASAKAMLCRDGWEMPLKYWDSIPGEVVRDVVGGDGFFIPGEWDRWVLAKRMLDRRLKQKAVDVGFLDGFVKTRPKAPDTPTLLAVRFNPTLRKEYVGSKDNTVAGIQQEKWCSLYTHPEVEPILSLLEDGIHYIHLEFEHLLLIRQAKDIFGLPVLADRLITEAQWMQLELRHKVLSARDADMDLGLSLAIEPEKEATEKDINTGPSSPSLERSPSSSKGKQRAVETPEPAPSLRPSASSDASQPPSYSILYPDVLRASPRKYFIPSQDCNIVMGGNADPVITTSSTSQRQGMSFDDFGPDITSSPPDNTAMRPTTPASTSTDKSSSGQPKPQSYTAYPPFRFSVEFQSPRLLKEKKRVYSRTVFYAGSLWNVYIQKVRSAKNHQLGVYLHRAKEREFEDAVISGVGTGATSASVSGPGLGIGGWSAPYAGYANIATRSGTVDEQIGMLEREMLLRSERRERRFARSSATRGQQVQSADLSATRHTNAGDASSASGDDAIGPTSSSQYTPMRNRNHRTNSAGGGATLDAQQASFSFPQSSSLSSPSSSDASDDDDADNDDVFNAYATIPPSGYFFNPTPATDSAPVTRRPRKLIVRSTSGSGNSNTVVPTSARDAAAGNRDIATRPALSRLPTLPPYVDARPTIRTWFKIYSPSKGGRLLSVYESAPDRFNFSQSWGWKSGSLMLDEGFDTGINAPVIGFGGDDGGDGDGLNLERNESLGAGAKLPPKKKWKPKGEGKLRFMIVIGNL